MNKLKQLRLEKNLTQTEIAKLTGIEYQNYNKYELNKNEPNIQTLIKLANFFDVSLDYLCERQWNNQVGYIPDNKKDDIKKILNMPDDQFKQLMSYAQALIDTSKK